MVGFHGGSEQVVCAMSAHCNARALQLGPFQNVTLGTGGPSRFPSRVCKPRKPSQNHGWYQHTALVCCYNTASLTSSTNSPAFLPLLFLLKCFSRDSSHFGLLDVMPWGLIGCMQNKCGFVSETEESLWMLSLELEREMVYLAEALFKTNIG